MIIDKEIEIKLNGSNIKNYYEKYGKDLKVNNLLVIDVNDLSDYSNHLINCKCELCGFENKISKANYTINKKNGGFYCCKKCNRVKFKNTCREKYGVENVFQVDEVKDKIKESNIEKYGVDNPFKSEDIKEKIRNILLDKYGKECYIQTEDYKIKSKITNLKNFGVEYPMQSDVIKGKSSNTCLEKYGVDHPMKLDEIREKSKITNLKNFGVEYPMQSDVIKGKSRNTCLEKYGFRYSSQYEGIKEKIKNTNIERYGFPCVLQNEDIKRKIRNTNIEKYGVPYPSQSELFLNKVLKLKIKPYNDKLYYQGTYELDFLNLCNKIGIIDIIKRGPTIKYNDDKVYYPDFFIDKYNLIIEIKSKYTYNLHLEKNEKKMNSCIDYGYKFMFVVDKDYKDFLYLINNIY